MNSDGNVTYYNMSSQLNSETTINLTLYIDPSLLGQLATFTLARNVNGVSNVIFQSKANSDLLTRNNFAWKQSYQIAATDNITDGALISRSTSQVNIMPGYVSYFSNQNLQPEVLAPAGTMFNAGNFGTINLPSGPPPRETLMNIIYGATVASDSGPPVYVPIYADASPQAGLTMRAYSVQNQYLVSFESSTDNQRAGVYVETWATPFAFSFNTTQTQGWISWGPPAPNDPNQNVRFFEYSTDPGRHNPAVANPQSSAVVVSNGRAPNSPAPGGANSPVQFSLNWDNLTYLSDSGKRAYATRLGQYLTASKPSFLTLGLSDNSTTLTATASLDTMSDFYDVLEGCNRNEKTTLLVQSLLRGTNSKYSPTSQVIQYGGGTPNNGNGGPGGFFGAAVEIAWNFVGANAPALAAAGIPVAFLFLRNLINARYASTRDVTIQYTPPSITSGTGTATINITGINAPDAVAVLRGVVALVQAEGNRTTRPTNAPSGLPTPDPVRIDDLTYSLPGGNRAGGAFIVGTIEEQPADSSYYDRSGQVNGAYVNGSYNYNNQQQAKAAASSYQNYAGSNYV